MYTTFNVTGLAVFLVALACLPLGTFAETDNLVYINDELYHESFFTDYPPIVDRSTATTTKVLAKTNHERFFDILSNYENFKIDKALWNTSQLGRRTFSKMKYVVCPVWLTDESNIPANVTRMNTVMQLTKEFYDRMSWNQHEITWEFLPDLKLTNLFTTQDVTRDQTSDQCKQYLASIGYTYPESYTGLVVAYNPIKSGELAWKGGVAIVNGNIVWNALPFNYAVHRHEVGHNYGHPHHSAYSYGWRNNILRDFTNTVPDGYDMMSGGNSPQADGHLTAASKYFFNWMTKDAVITMHPDGSTFSCVFCVDSVTNVVLKAFDRPDIVPSASNLMAIQIPVLGIGTSVTYSYWLSYRSNYTDSRNGLSMHLIRFSLGRQFGAYVDSLNFDAVGTTATTKDSFIVNGECYVIQPPGILLDIDPATAEKIQPVVCVNDIAVGESITVTVSFLSDNDNEPEIDVEKKSPLVCKTGGINFGEGTIDVTNNKVHLIEFQGSGLDGNVTFSLCHEETAGFVNAYFYDSYPHAYLSYNAPLSYGALLSVNASKSCADKNVTEYSTEYGQTYVLIVADEQVSSNALIRYSASCNVKTCHAGQYRNGSDGVCVNCPAGFVSAAGSLSANDCLSCLIDGLEPVGSKSKDCIVSSNAYPAMNTGDSWRIIIHKDHTFSGSVNIQELEFYSLDDCSLESKISTAGGFAFSSNTNAAEAPKAFNAPGRWFGKSDPRDLFYLGIKLNRTVTVKCIIYRQESLQTRELRVQTKVSGEDNWKNVWIARNIPDINTTIPFVVVPTNAPTIAPTPTAAPIGPPTVAPIRTPNLSPMSMPSPIGSQECTSAEDVCRGGLFRFFQDGTTMHRTFLGRCTERCSTTTLFRGFMTIFGWKCGQCP